MKIITKPRTLELNSVNITTDENGELQQHITFFVFEGKRPINKITMQVGDTLSIQHTTNISLLAFLIGYLRGGVVTSGDITYER